MEEFYVNKHGVYFNIGISILVTLLIVGLYVLMGLNKCSSQENFWDVSLPAKCKGGSFFWGSGDSELSKECRALASTPEGECALSNQNCPKGYVGSPKVPFFYSSLSDDSWHNDRCLDVPDCGCRPNGECRMVANL